MDEIEEPKKVEEPPKEPEYQPYVPLQQVEPRINPLLFEDSKDNNFQIIDRPVFRE